MDVNGSLQAILIYVEEQAKNSIGWYWEKKRSKALFSQTIRFLAFALTALGGIFPIAAIMLNPILPMLHIAYKIPPEGLASSLFVGLAAGLYGLDKAFGFSSGWTRYVLTATLLEKSLEEFRLQWTILLAKLSQPPTIDQIEALLECAKDFRAAVAGAVLEETKDWVTEFQNNLGQLERDTQAQLEVLRAKVETTVQSQAEASRPGAVELAVADAARADGYAYDVELEDQKGSALKESVHNTMTWAAIGVPPGQYRLRLRAKMSGQDVTVTKVLIVKPNETTGLQLQLFA